ncbi:PQQ-dependent sugar dehydrogenase, partial [Escherichia coli]|uniref:PQQ-dependent sugar dehydrogenase n=1 Tax=Escherichia coli TaxID=562 RepID=UPI0014121CA2
FVVEIGGTVQTFPHDDPTSRTVFMDLSSINNVTGDLGLLSIAFHPDFATNGYVFAYYSGLTASGPQRSVISRFAVAA